MYYCKFCSKEYKSKAGCSTHESFCNLNPNKKTIWSKGLKVKSLSKPKQRKLCNKCEKMISVCNFNKHYQICGTKHKFNVEVKDKIKQINENKYECLLCGKVSSKYGIINHIVYGHTKTGKQHLEKLHKNRRGKPAWNKGLTSEVDERIRNRINTLRNRISKGEIIYKGKPHTDEFKKKARELAIKNNLGGVRKSKKIFYNGYYLGSSYEYKLALDLDRNNIKWIVPSRLKYKDKNGKIRYYTPDFYLPDYDIYLDPKNNYLINNINPVLGFKDSDKIKWVCEQNNIKCYILNEKQLNWNYIKAVLIQ